MAEFISPPFFFSIHYKCHLKSALMPGQHAETGNTGMPQSVGTDGEREKHFYVSEGKSNRCKRIFMWHLLTVFFLQAVSVLLFKRCKYNHCGLAGTRKMGLRGWMELYVKPKRAVICWFRISLQRGFKNTSVTFFSSWDKTFLSVRVFSFLTAICSHDLSLPFPCLCFPKIVKFGLNSSHFPHLIT